MTTRGVARFALFQTPLGACAIAWHDGGIVGVQLPEGNEAQTRARMRRRFAAATEAAPSPRARAAIESIAALLRGEAADLSAIVVDMSAVAAFERQVYQAARAIPPGETMSYGDLAARLGQRGLARSVGRALARNPFPIVVPCHRVVAASGKLGGFTARGGVATKLRMLTIEGRGREQMALFEGDTAAAHLRASDPVMARVVEVVGPCRLERRHATSLFAALAEAIVYQQLSGAAAATIHARLCALFPEPQRGLTPEHILRSSDEKLRGAGLSAAKLLSLRDLARRAKKGEIPSLADAGGMEDEELIERLTAVRGIGRWTVEMLLIFRLGRPDVLPVDDYGVRKGFAVAARRRALPTPKDLAARGQRWAPHRTAASWYLWRVADRGSL